MTDDIDAPHPDDHEAIAVRSNLDAVKELFGWARKFGIRFENAEVSAKGIAITGIVDDYPRSKLFKEPTPADDVEDGDAYSAAVAQYGERPAGPK